MLVCVVAELTPIDWQPTVVVRLDLKAKHATHQFRWKDEKDKMLNATGILFVRSNFD